MNIEESPGRPARSEAKNPAAEAAAPAACESQFSTRYVVILVALAFLCAGAGWALGEFTHNLFPWNDAYVFHRYRKEIDEQPSDRRAGYILNKVLLTRKIADSKNTAIVDGALGGCLGLALGLLGAFLRPQPRHTRRTATAGFLLGIAAGAIPSFALVPYFFDNFNPRSTIALPFLVHFGLWAGIGAAAGLALSIGMGRWRDLGRGFIGGMAGVFAGTLLYHLINPAFFPLDQDLPIPIRETSRFVAALCVSLGAAIGSWAYLSADRPAKPASEVSLA
jgi:hypothetical protein